MNGFLGRFQIFLYFGLRGGLARVAVGQVVEAEGLRFEVLEMDKRRIALVDVRRIT